MKLWKWKLMQASSLGVLVLEYMQDFTRFLRFGKGSPFAPNERRVFFDSILFVHTVEKGLSLQSPRPFFGQDNFRIIEELLAEYPKGASMFPVRMAKTAMTEYLDFHQQKELQDPFLDEVRNMLGQLNNRFPDAEVFEAGMRDISAVFGNVAEQRLNYAQFLQSRFSCRSYALEAVPLSLVQEVVKVAQSAPSQCNRQSAKIHFYQDEAMIQQLLGIQGGSRGFSEEVKNLFVVSSEITAWSASSARNQDYIDGSLFAMNLLLSCHAHGLAACPLNLAFRNSKEKSVRVAGGIPESERLLMMISFGFPNKEVSYAASSPRLPTEEVFIVH
jgi:nitroreductase